MEKEVALSELIEKVITELERLRYTEDYIKKHRTKYREFSRFVKETIGTEVYTEKLSAKFLKQVYGYTLGEPVKNFPKKVEGAVRCIRHLGEMKQYGALVRFVQDKENTDWAESDTPFVEAYLTAVQTADNSEATKKNRTHNLKLFYGFLKFRKIHSINELTAQIISDYALSIQGGSLAYAKNRFSTLKLYFRFLFTNGFCEQDWSQSVPRIIIPKNLNVPALWTADEIDRLVKSIDRGSPAGKRNYAILLLAIQFGIRVSDIANLKLENLKWDKKEIQFSQHKTGNQVTYPMLEDVGWALIDYIRFARSKSDGPFVFLGCNAPYVELRPGSVGSIMKRQMRCCGINKQPDTLSGMHSLRHALVRRLVEQGTPLTTVAEIMGHVSYSSTSPYLKVDIDGLRKCALSIEEVLSND